MLMDIRGAELRCDVLRSSGQARIVVLSPPPPARLAEAGKAGAMTGLHIDPGARRRGLIVRFEMLLERGRARDPTVRQIIKEVADKHGVSVGDILSARRPRRIANARREAMYRACTETGLSCSGIGRAFNKDHSTVIYALAQYRKGKHVVGYRGDQPSKKDRSRSAIVPREGG